MLGSTLLFFNFNASEIMFILFVALILFGGDKFPEIARGLGKGIREFKDMSDGVKREIHQQINNYDAEPRRDAESTAMPTPPAEVPHETASGYQGTVEGNHAHEQHQEITEPKAVNQTPDTVPAYTTGEEQHPAPAYSNIAVTEEPAPVYSNLAVTEEPAPVYPAKDVAKPAEKPYATSASDEKALPAPKKPDLTPPPNTISHQSY